MDTANIQLYIYANGKQEGPFSIDAIQQMILKGAIATASTMAWYQGCPE